MPYYSAAQAVKGLYVHDLPIRAQAFANEAHELVSATQGYCAGKVQNQALQERWVTALELWQRLATPAIGPLVERRSQRAIDFWPSRDKLIRRALKKAPRTLQDMGMVGTPAKGFGGFERLLAPAGDAGADWPSLPLRGSACSYLLMVAKDIDREGSALLERSNAMAAKDWSDAEEDVSRLFAEWVNQWLGGLERLRWAYIGKPLAQAETAREVNPGAPLSLARFNWAHNVRDWRAQWASLSAMAVLSDAQRLIPPTGDDGVPPIEALLLGKGYIDLAGRWHSAVARVSSLVTDLDTSQPASHEKLKTLTDAMQAVANLYQDEVASALDVPLGFSDADGD
ncbi:hypothetical protein NBRC116584_20630 [Hydrogenophaga sp. 5NK40-0174]